MFELPKVFVRPGAGVKVPLPVGGEHKIPAEGKEVLRTGHVERLLRTGDLVEATAPAPAAPGKADEKKG